MTDDDVRWMNRALAEASKGRGAVEPNPMVGCVIVQEGGRLVGAGHHARFGGPHAEVAALAEAGSAASGATMYVTLEPCCHQGKTPPCTAAIIRAGVSRVVAAMRDPFPMVDGGGLRILREAGIQAEVGVLGMAAAELNAPYLKRIATGLPYITAKWAMTLDGKTAVSSGQSQWISSAGSRRLVHQLRGRMDAILVGIGTVLLDDPMLTARPAGPRVATRVVLDSRAALPTTCRLARTARDVPVLVAVSEDAPADRRAALLDCGCELMSLPGRGRVPLDPLLRELGRRGMTNVLVEGGGRVLGSFLDEHSVDAVEAYIAPLLEGGDHAYTSARGRGSATMNDAVRLTGVSCELVDGDLRVQGVVAHPWRSMLESLGSERPP